MDFFYIIEISFLLNIAYRELKSSRWKQEFEKKYSTYFNAFEMTESIGRDILKKDNLFQPEGKQFVEGLEKGEKNAWENKFFIPFYYRNFICKEWSKKFTGCIILGIIIIIGILYFFAGYNYYIYIKNTSFVAFLIFSMCPFIFSFFDNRCYNYLFGDNGRIEFIIKEITRKNKSMMDDELDLPERALK